MVVSFSRNCYCMPQQSTAYTLVMTEKGFTHPAARRRVQNRLNQRAYREYPAHHDFITCRLSRMQHQQCTFAPANRAVMSYIRGVPETDHFLKMSKYGMTVEWVCEDNTVSIFSLFRPHLSEDSIPQSSRPTLLQRAVPHHPWLDILPFPPMRDNLVRAGNSLDDDELCLDLTAFWDTRSSNAPTLRGEKPLV
ncbi:hypothetical protein BJY01DRAFT_238087 [Aspergillus pseudoustus]|uniref:Uncharacterized protein n=1 Tax=Aspergillus pseudoustus TaxID=1810923 RepID=A0ABR4JA00_9EURO